jgi:DNA helicase II / ATP-dependent DNA helicase PcrA
VTPELQKALVGLNPAQREAVLYQSGPLLILAGAGSGKTRVVTVKIAYLIGELGVDPRSILAVTFTNKAAGEMRQRAAALVEHASDVTIRTFHSFGAWLLRRNADAVGLSRNFSIYDDDDSITLLRSLYPEQKRAVMARYYHLISRAKDYCLGPEDDLSDISSDPEFVEVYRSYQKRIDEIGNVDFGDLIMKPVKLLESESVVADRIRRRFRHILVDEYQDSNVAQYRLLYGLSDPESFVCVVGDDDQSIYRFRGAEVQNILTFPEIFAETKVVRLEQNYRSTAPILDLAGAVVANNEGRLGKTLFTDRQDGEKPRLLLLEDYESEVDFVIDLVREAERRGQDGETAVLYRTNAQSRPFETTLLREGIPYRIIGAVRFYDREEVKDAVAFLKFVANPRDEVSFRRIVNKPARGIGNKGLALILGNLPAARGDLAVAANYTIPNLSRKAAAALSEFLKLLEDIRRTMGSADGEAPGQAASDGDAADTAAPSNGSNDHTLAAIVEDLLDRSGLARYHQEQDEFSGTQKLQNLEELVNAASLYSATVDGLSEFLEAIELDSAREQGDVADARVILITMHNTKGLEFDRVVITGLEETLFPRDDDPEELEEERRLFYVAITRARHELYLTSCRYRRVHGRMTDLLPSRFLAEIPPELVDIQSGSSAGSFGPASGRTAQQRALSSLRGGSGGPDMTEHPLPRGTAVYHDNYGSGVVTKAWYSGSEAVVMVRFETGATAQFLPAYTPLERIAGSADDEPVGEFW